MNNEIKEILDKLKDGNWYEEKDLTGTMWIELRWEETHLLLDYITNLQQENQELKSELECYENGVYFSSKVDELQQENDKLKKLEYKLFYCSEDEESFILEDYLELGNKVYDLEKENEKIRKQNLYEHKYGSDMEGKYLIEKQKNDRAVEYIKEHNMIVVNKEYIPDGISTAYDYELMNILNGRSDE